MVSFKIIALHQKMTTITDEHTTLEAFTQNETLCLKLNTNQIYNHH